MAAGRFSSLARGRRPWSFVLSSSTCFATESLAPGPVTVAVRVPDVLRGCHQDREAAQRRPRAQSRSAAARLSQSLGHGALVGECTRIGHVIGVCLHVHASFAVATSLVCPWNMVPPPPPSKNTVKHPGFARRRQTTMLRTSRRAPAAIPWLRMPWGLMRYSALGVIAAAPRQVAASGVYYLFCTAHVAPHAPSNACTAPVAVLEQELWFMSCFSRMRLKASYASS